MLRHAIDPSSSIVRREDPIFSAVSTGNAVLVFDDEDESSMRKAVDNVARALSTSLFDVGSDGRLEGRLQDGGGSILSSVTVVPSSSGHRAGTVIIPIGLSSRGVTLIAIIKPLIVGPDPQGGAAYTGQSAMGGGGGATASGGAATPPSIRQSSNTIAVILGCWMVLSTVVKETVAELDAKRKQQQAALRQFLARAALSVRSSFPTLSTTGEAFERLKSHMLRARLETSLLEASHAGVIRQRVRKLEKSMADWTELVKGINGASGGVSHGLGGLWAQACRTLISMMSSHLTLKGCGLLVKDLGAREEILDYSVRELSTPYVGNKYASSEELPDYARGMLEVRPAEELGSRVHTIVFDMLNGHAGNQRLVKLTRQDEGGSYLASATAASAVAAEEQLWLVPIRTARAVLGVLRINVEIQTGQIGSNRAAPPVASAVAGAAGAAGKFRRPAPLPPRGALRTQFQSQDGDADDDDGLSTPQPRPGLGRGGATGMGRAAAGGGGVDGGRDVGGGGGDGVFAEAMSVASDDSSNSYSVRVEAAQSNAINFAEVLAPLLSASQQVQYLQSATTDRDEQLRAHAVKYKGAVEETTTQVQRLSLLSTAVAALGEVFEISF